MKKENNIEPQGPEKKKKNITKVPKPRGYWTKERVLADSNTYKNYPAWAKSNCTSYLIALKRKWIRDVGLYLSKQNKLITKKEVKLEALKYKTRSEFQDNSRLYYKKALANNWMDDCCKHMEPRREWTIKTITEVFSTYGSRRKIWREVPAAASAAKRLGIYEEMTKLLPPKRIPKPKSNRVIIPRGPAYYTLSDKALIKLGKSRIGNSETRKQYSKKNGGLVQLLRDRGLWDAVAKGFKNERKLDALKRTIWTIDTIPQEALKYRIRYAFSKGSPGAYNAARKLGILNKVCSHMETGYKAKYSKDYILKEALKYETKEEFREKARNIYNAAWERGFYKEATKHMKHIVRREEEKEYPKFDKIFRHSFKIHKTDRNKNLFGFSPDRIIEKDNIFYIIEIKRDTIKDNSTKQMIKYENFAKDKFKEKFGGAYLLSRKGRHPKSQSFNDFFLFVTQLHESIINGEVTAHAKIPSWTN